ncbi:MAG: Ku protein [Actinobacteria bacterium]|nr:Ku protein [Actinomycetota bacterium]
MARALWKGAISFGLVTIPVSLYPAKNARENISFHMLHRKDLSRVHNRWVDEADHEVPYEDIVKGYEYEKGQYAVIAEADLKAANVQATQQIEILHFVDAKDVDIAYFDTPYYTEPAKIGRRAYALLRETLIRTNRIGLAKIVIRERQHLCAVLADGPVILAYTLRWPYQLRTPTELDLPSEDIEELGISTQELQMAEQLVNAMAAAWDPSHYRDTYREDILKLIATKVEGGKVKAPAARRPEAKGAEVIDIMDLLKKSVERQKTGTGTKTGTAHARSGARPKRSSGRRATGVAS